jgi:hypothetical protein
MQTIVNGESGASVRSKFNSNATEAGLKQNGSAELSAIAALSAVNDDFIQRKGGVWVNRTIAQVQADLLVDAVANGSTKGIAAFTAADFTAASGVISINYTSGQAATSGQKGFLTAADWTTFNGKAGLASPTFTGTPLAPTATPGTNTTQIATTAFVTAAVVAAGGVPTARTISTTSPLAGGGDLSANRTLSIADAAADGTTKGAATFAAADFSSSAGVISIDYTNGQAATGSVKGFLTSADWTTFNGKAGLASPTFTGTPLAPTAVVGTNTTQIATTAFVIAQIATLGTVVATSRTISTTAPLAGGGDLSANRTLTIADAAADGTTKGAATFTATDFSSASGVISIDYTNGQAANGSTKGFLIAADWTTFNGKAPTASPTFTGTPIAPTAALQTNSTQIATTAYVDRLYSPRVQQVASSATVTPVAGTNDLVEVTAQAAALALANPSGTPVNGQAMIIRIKDNGTSRTISFGADYRAFGTSITSISTTISKWKVITMIYNSTDSKWDVMSIIDQS